MLWNIRRWGDFVKSRKKTYIHLGLIYVPLIYGTIGQTVSFSRHILHGNSSEYSVDPVDAFPTVRFSPPAPLHSPVRDIIPVARNWVIYTNSTVKMITKIDQRVRTTQHYEDCVCIVFCYNKCRPPFTAIINWSYGLGSSFGIATDYGLDGPGSNPGGDEIFRPSRPVLGPIQPPVKWVRVLSQG